MKGRHSSEAVLNAVELHQSHSFVHRRFQNMDVLDVAVLAEDFEEGLLVADIPFERGDVESIRRRVDCDRLLFSEST